MEKMSEKISAAKQWYLTHERKLIPLALLGGFLFDWFTVTRVDQLYGNILLVVYILIAALGILIIHLYDTGRLTAPVGSVTYERWLTWLRMTTPLIIQVAFGGLFSVFLVFYSRAGSFSVSWIFLLLLAGLMIGNELFRDYYRRIEIQVGILFLCVFLFSIYFLPILLLSFGTAVFVLAGVVSLGLIILYFGLLQRLSLDYSRPYKKRVYSAVVGVFAVVNLLYFTGIVPPLPLTMQESVVAHSVQRSAGNYIIEIEKESLAERVTENWLWFVRDEIHVQPGETIYFFSSVFAPTDLTVPITHHWEYYNPETKTWVNAGQISFPVYGGRADGYRGFSLKSRISPGWWRVSVETPDGRVVGRETFAVIQSGSKPEITTEIR